MVHISAIRTANEAFVNSQPLVAVFSGATQGIGEYTLRTLVKYHGANGPGLRVYLIGRRQEPADKLFAEFKTISPSAEFVFVKAADLTLLKDADGACHEILTMESKAPFRGGPPRVDLLCMTQGFVRFGEPKYTPEGLEVSMVLLYYSRMRMINNLMTLLTESTITTGARIISVYAAGKGAAKMRSDDLSLTKDPSQYTFMRSQAHCVHMKTMYFEHLAKAHEGKLSLSHIFPGIVVTPNYEHPSFPWWFKALLTLLGGLIKMFASIAPDESGERMLYLAGPTFPARSAAVKSGSPAVATDGVVGGGAYSLNEKDEVNDILKTYEPLRKEGFERQVVEHTNAVFAAIDAGKNWVIDSA